MQQLKIDITKKKLKLTLILMSVKLLISFVAILIKQYSRGEIKTVLKIRKNCFTINENYLVWSIG